jgi:transposase-like protein
MTKIFGQQDRAELVAAIKRGESVPAAARRFGIARSTVYTWIRRAGAAEVTPAQPRFMELVPSRGPEVGFVVRVGTAEIEVRAGFDGELLRAVVAALGGVS